MKRELVRLLLAEVALTVQRGVEEGESEFFLCWTKLQMWSRGEPKDVYAVALNPGWL